MKIEGSFLGALAGLAARFLPMFTTQHSEFVVFQFQTNEIIKIYVIIKREWGNGLP